MVPSLLAVKLLFRSKPELEALHHVEQKLPMFVDSSVELPLAKACKFGSLTLMDRILDSQLGIEASHWSIRSLMQSEESYQRHQFNLSLLEAARRSDVAMMKWLFNHFRGGFAVPRKVVEEAAAVGNMETLDYFLDNDNDELLESDDEKSEEEKDLARRVIWGGKDAANAIRAGHPEVAMWLYEHVNVNREEYDTLKAAAAMGDVEFFEWLDDKIDQEIELDMREAAANGHLEMVQRLYAQEFDEEDTYCDRGVLVAAAEKGQLEVVRWLIEHDGEVEGYHADSDLESEDGYHSGGESIHTAVNMTRRPHITNVGGEASVAMNVAAMNDHLEVAKHLFACVDKPMDKKGRRREKDRLDRTLEALWGVFKREHYSTYLSEETMLVAAREGRLDVVKWLYTEFGINPRINLFGIYNNTEEKLYTAIDIAAINGIYLSFSICTK